MRVSPGKFMRDFSQRLTYEIHDVDSLDYPPLAARIIKHFQLTPASELLIGFDEMCRDYTDGERTIGLEWDNWSGFMVVAQDRDSESLVRRVAAFLAKSK